MYSSSIDKTFVIFAYCKNIYGRYSILKSDNDHFYPQFAMKVPYFLLSRINTNLSAISHTGKFYSLFAP